jgi:hypothetical protein
MSATIIDFNAFRPNRRVADRVTRDRPSTTAAEGVLADLFFYPVFLAWLPFCLMALPARIERPLEPTPEP